MEVKQHWELGTYIEKGIDYEHTSVGRHFFRQEPWVNTRLEGWPSKPLTEDSIRGRGASWPGQCRDRRQEQLSFTGALNNNTLQQPHTSSPEASHRSLGEPLRLLGPVLTPCSKSLTAKKGQGGSKVHYIVLTFIFSLAVFEYSIQPQSALLPS